MKEFFDRTVRLNLDRRQDRWKRFEGRLREADWPFGPVIRVLERETF